MSKEPNNIDRLIREKLDGFEMTPPASAWEATASNLAAGRKRRRFFLSILFIVSALGLLAIGSYFFVLDDDQEVVAQNNQQQRISESHQQEQATRSTTINGKSDSGNATVSESSENSAEKNDTNDSFEETFTNGSDKSELRSKKSTSKTTEAGTNGGNTKGFSTDGDSNKGGDSNSLGKQTDRNASASSGGQKRTSRSGGTNKPTGLTTQQGGDGENVSSSGERSTSTTSEKNDSSTNPSGQTVSDSSHIATDSLPLNPAQLISQPSGSIVFRNEEDELPAVRPPLWKFFSLEASLGVSTFKNVPSSTLTDPSIASALSNVASDQISWDARFGVNYYLTDRFSFGSGLQYYSSREKYAYKSEEISTYTVVDSITFTVDTSTWDTTYITHTSTYDSSTIVSGVGQNVYTIFTLPFQFNWTQPIGPRSSLEFSLGGAISLFGKNTGLVLPDTSDFAISAQEGYHTSGMLSVGGSMKYIYRFGNHHSVYAEPWLQLGITNQSTPSLNYESLRRRYGIRIGYRFYF